MTVSLRHPDWQETVVTREDGTFVAGKVPSGELALTAMLTESITVQSETPRLDRGPVAPSQNVINLQRRTLGVLPIRVDVPRAGTSHQFVRPLVVDQETVMTLRDKRR